MRPKHLAMNLSKLQPHPCTDVLLEQYATEGDLAAYWLLAVDQLDGFEGKTVLDLGAGNGVLGLGALMLGAAKVVLVETDADALDVLRQNVNGLGPALAQRAVVKQATLGIDEIANEGVDIVMMNPPWGVHESKGGSSVFGNSLFQRSIGDSPPPQRSSSSCRGDGERPRMAWRGGLANRIQAPCHLCTPCTTNRGSTDVMCWRFHRGRCQASHRRGPLRHNPGGSKGGNPRIKSANGVRPTSGHACERNENHDGEPRHPRKHHRPRGRTRTRRREPPWPTETSFPRSLDTSAWKTAPFPSPPRNPSLNLRLATPSCAKW